MKFLHVRPGSFPFFYTPGPRRRDCPQESTSCPNSRTRNDSVACQEVPPRTWPSRRKMVFRNLLSSPILFCNLYIFSIMESQGKLWIKKKTSMSKNILIGIFYSPDAPVAGWKSKADIVTIDDPETEKPIQAKANNFHGLEIRALRFFENPDFWEFLNNNRVLVSYIFWFIRRRFFFSWGLVTFRSFDACRAERFSFFFNWKLHN